MNILIPLKLTLFVIIMFSFRTYAYVCNTNNIRITLNIPDIYIQKNLPIGTQIGSENVTPVIDAFNCNNTNPPLDYQAFGGKAYGSYYKMLNSRRIYKTNIRGIGFAVGIQDINNCHASGYVDGEDIGDNNMNNKLVCQDRFLHNQPLQGTIKISYFKTEDTTDTGQVNGGRVAAFILRNNNQWQRNEVEVHTNNFQVISGGCTVMNRVIPVSMGEIQKKKFSGIGSWPGDSNTRNFTIPILCEANTLVSLRVSGNIYDPSLGVLQLNQSANAASGIGIQLLMNNTPFTLDVDTPVSHALQSGMFLIPLQSRYYQIANPITTGEANASATFTFTYQ